MNSKILAYNSGAGVRSSLAAARVSLRSRAGRPSYLRRTSNLQDSFSAPQAGCHTAGAIASMFQPAGRAHRIGLPVATSSLCPSLLRHHLARHPWIRLGRPSCHLVHSLRHPAPSRYPRDSTAALRHQAFRQRPSALAAASRRPLQHLLAASPAR